MNSRMMDYRARMASRDGESLELRSLSIVPHALPIGVGDLGYGFEVPFRFMEGLRRAARNREWPWYIHGNGGRGVACAVYRKWCGSAQWLPFVDVCQGKVNRTLLRMVDMIVIDEVAAVHEQAESRLREILRDRQGKPLIITGSLSPEELGVFGEAVRASIVAGKVVDFNRRDLRSRICERGMPVD